MKNINLKINNIELKASSDQTILQVARANGIYIPTLCYLAKTSPIGSCRLCVVEEESSEGFVLSCQTPVREGISIKTESPKLFEERQKIMAMYDVNHPLQCGVCDKSGECDLQNKTSEFGVSNQPFAVRDQHRPLEKWGFIEYDPALCIMCERCVRVCNEIVGDNRLKVQAGGYKSKIALNGELTDRCSECGECMAVCPVGALVSAGFKYTSNAWELKKTPSTCTHCSAGCELFYETKQSGVDNKTHKIYRITNDVELSSLCGAGRFGFGYESDQPLDQDELKITADQIKNAKTVIFDANITNEEALILSKLSKQYGFDLYNKDAKPFQDFLKNYSSKSGKVLYSGSVANLSKSDAVILFGAPIVDEAPTVRTALNRASRVLGAYVVDMSPRYEPRLDRVVNQAIRYEVGAEEGVMALLLKTLLKTPDGELSKWLDDLDDGYLSAESNVGEEELELLSKKLVGAKNISIVLGSDLYTHPRAAQIAKMAGILSKNGYEVLMIPPATNALGVSLLCELSDQIVSPSVGIKTDADFVIRKLPPLSQQEGTITTIEKMVKPINPSLKYSGMTLAHIANELGFDLEWTVDLTPSLPTNAGFKQVEFDDLNFGSRELGYTLDEVACEISSDWLDDVGTIGAYNGLIVRYQNPSTHISKDSAKSPNLARSGVVRGSNQFAIAAKITDGSRVLIRTKNGEIEKDFVMDKNLKGTVAELEFFDIDCGVKPRYPYEVVAISLSGGNK